MIELVCPACGSEDLRRDSAVADGDIGIVCQGCGHHWRRTPNVVCPACDSADVDENVTLGLSTQAAEEARQMASGVRSSAVDTIVHRCRACGHHWESAG